MIEEKIENARLRSSNRKMRLGVGLFLSLGLCGLLLFLVSVYDFSEKGSAPAVTPPEDTSLEDTPPKEEPSPDDMEKTRNEFKEALQQYENELEPGLEAANAETWNKEAFLRINELKKQMLLNFSNGDYPAAMKDLQLVKSLTREVIEEADHIFEENMEKATSMMAEDLYDEAKFHIEKALLVNPQSPEALRLQLEIEKLPPTLVLLNGAKAARAENDLQKEYDFLRQVSRIAPEREGVNQRLKVLAGRIKNQKFDAQISAGFADIEKGRAKEARNHYQAAKKIDPGRVELSLLYDKLSALERSQRVQQAVRQAEEAILRDDWQQAKRYFAKAAKDAPENKVVAEGLKLADHIIALLSRFRRYFENPYRLANANVRKEAEQTLIQARQASSHSMSIKRQSEQLSELITKINKPVPVTIISDNNTYILVRSVGKVGIVSQKIIELKPGNYTFEGVRKGFKSKLVQVFISHDQKGLSVRVVCDERI